MAALEFPSAICARIKDFLTNRSQTVRISPHKSSTIMLSTGSPQSCVLSLLLFTIYTHDCAPTHHTNLIIKFADDTILVGFITDRNKSTYRDEVQRLVE